MPSMNGHANEKDEYSLEHARQLDQNEPLRGLRDNFIIPTKADLHRGTIRPTAGEVEEKGSSEPGVYFCGNSLGLQPRCVSEYVNAQLGVWATKGVFGHFRNYTDSKIPSWLELDDAVTVEMAKIVGAQQSEVVVMQTLTANLHLLLASFYQPNKDRYKIILEGKAFPSDHYVVESQLKHHGLDPADAMVLIEPPNPDESPLIPTEHILATIDAHAASTAILLLPGIQFYTGQLLDMESITAHAQAKGIVVGWDLAHAVGNVPLALHDWNADFAAWCNYKYMNCGPGASGGLFIHARHTSAAAPRPRLAGWWGSSKASRFAMTNTFEPLAGAAGFQLSNPCAVDLAAVLASLSVFAQTDVGALRARSLALTGYLAALLDAVPAPPFCVITPREPAQRGAQLSVLLRPGLLDAVMRALEADGVVLDERKPDVIRVAPAPLYNTFEDVWRFMDSFRRALRLAVAERDGAGASDGAASEAADGKEAKGWSEVK